MEKHQLYSLIIIAVCLVLIIITEICFQKIDDLLSYGEFALALFYLLLIEIFLALLDSIEKYLYEYDYINQFIVLMLQGFFGLIMSSLFYIKENPLTEIIQVYKTIYIFVIYVFCLKWT